MMILDLPPAVEQMIVQNAQNQGTSPENYIMSLLPDTQNNADLAWEYGKHLFGQYNESTDGTLSQNAKTYIAQAIKEKHRAKQQNFD